MRRKVSHVSREPRLRLARASVARCLRAVEASGVHPVAAGDIGVAFVTEAECGRLHAEFFGDPEVTDVMTFPGEPGDGHAGDIALCPAVAARASRSGGLPFAEELTLYLVHAWLHLSGMDDRNPPGRSAMRAAEERLMDHLRARGALLDCSWTACALTPGP